MAEITKETEVKEVIKTEEVKAPAGTVEVAKAAPAKPAANGAKPGNRPNNQRGGRPGGRPGGNRKGGFQRRPQEFEERVVNVARVTTVVKGGRRFSFSVLVVIGDKKGRVGYGHGKAGEVPDAIKKATKDARRNLIHVPIINGTTVPHIIQGKFISSNVMLKPAPKGKGIIASGAVRSVVELAGYKDIVTKSLGSSNKTNVVKATLDALAQLRTVEQIAKLRDIKVEDVLGKA